MHYLELLLLYPFFLATVASKHQEEETKTSESMPVVSSHYCEIAILF